ncbi:MAG: hypothetical protein DLM57_11715 [Pseudonocardiales bacterium]|nr:MAG: hypothetical protein DLM57_11715 [Pseudonocardiales bacterium]
MTGEARAVPRDALHGLREQTEGVIAAMADDLDAVVHASSNANADDEHDPEGTTIAFERAQLLALLGSARRELIEIDSALGRVESGSYGRCEACGTDVGAERLLARPAARHCVGCASTHRRPVT